MATKITLPENVTHTTLATAIVDEARKSVSGDEARKNVLTKHAHALLHSLPVDNAIAKWHEVEKAVTEKATKTKVRRATTAFGRRVHKLLSTHGENTHVEFPNTWHSFVKTCEAIDAGFKAGEIGTRGKWDAKAGTFEFKRLVAKEEQDEIKEVAKAQKRKDAGAESGVIQAKLPADVMAVVEVLMLMDEPDRKAATTNFSQMLMENMKEIAELDTEAA